MSIEGACLKVNKISTGFRISGVMARAVIFSNSRTDKISEINLFRMKLKNSAEIFLHVIQLQYDEAC